MISFLREDSQDSPLTPQFKSINSLAVNFLYSPTLTSIHDYWKNHNLTRWTFVGKVMSLFLIFTLPLMIKLRFSVLDNGEGNLHVRIAAET